jgi:hypothetical protein
MIDSFILLAPILLLGVVALLGFIGCYHAGQFKGDTSATISPVSGPTAGGTLVTVTGGVITPDASDPAVNIIVKFGTPPDEADVPGTFLSGVSFTANTPPHAPGAVSVELDYYIASIDLHTKAVLPDGSFFTYYDPVVALLPPVLSRITGMTGVTTNSASLPAFSGTKLVVVTVEWNAGGATMLNTPTSPGVTFNPIGATDSLNPQDAATFFAFADLSSGITVTVTLNKPTNSDFNLLVSAYDNVDPASMPAAPASQQGIGTTPGPSLVFSTSALAPGDLIYAVAIARGAGTALKGSWSAGQGFTPQIGQNDYLLLETYVLQQSDITTGQLTVTATDADGTATSNWYIFATAIKHA